MSAEVATLDTLIYDESKCVLKYLPMHDLSNLACTSKALSRLVQDHWHVLLSKKCFEDQLSIFVETQLTLSDDLSAITMFQNGSKALGRIYAQCLRLCFTKRQSLVDFENIAYGEEPAYYQEIYEETLKRQVLHLKTICWLNLSHQFCDVYPGQYKVIVRMKFTGDFVWPQSRYPAIASVTWNDSRGRHQQNTAIFFTQWYDIRSRVVKGDKYKCLQGFCAMNYDAQNGWFDLCFEAVDISSPCDLAFVFRDTSNPWWKEGLLWDFVELQPVIQSNSFKI